MDKKVYEIHSEKYGVDGRVLDYGMVIKLEFSYEGREHSIGIERKFNNELSDVGLMIMERTIETLLESDSSGTAREPMLHNWFLDERGGAVIAHGVVTGHRKLQDAMFIHTSRVNSIEIDSEREEAVIITQNTTYRCRLCRLKFSKQDEHPELIPEYEKLREKYFGKLEEPEIEPGKVLLVLSDFDEYYFHSLCVKDKNGDKVPYSNGAHVGTFQDSYMIYTYDNLVDLRYFPHFKNLEFYELYTEMPVFVENIGGSVLYIRNGGHTFRLDPGVRIELSEENATENVPDLPNGDLYPAGIIE